MLFKKLCPPPPLAEILAAPLLVSVFLIAGVSGICHILLRRRPRNSLFMKVSPNAKGSALIMTGPDLLNPLDHVFARFRKGSEFALMADKTKCLFKIKFSEAQRDLCRLVWNENDAVHKSKLVPFCFCVHPWGIKVARIGLMLASPLKK